LPRFGLLLLLLLSIVMSSVSFAQSKSVPTTTPVASSQPQPSAGDSSADIGDVALTIAAKNPGVLLEIGWAASVDPKAIQVNFQALDRSKLSKADIMRVTLQCLSAVAPFRPTILIYARDGDQRLLMDGAEIPSIANEFNHGNKLAAVRMFAEKVKKPSGESITLPSGLIARSTASFDVADLLYKGSGADTSSSKGKSKDDLSSLANSDKWKRSTPEEHGEVAQKIIQTVRPAQINVKDGTRLDWKQVDGVIDALKELYLKALTDARIAAQQQEQGGSVDLPEGWSELLDLRIRYKELLPNIEDSTFLPLTHTVIFFAPESTFAGLTLYGKKGEVKGRITGKTKDWHSGVSTSGRSYYSTILTTDAGRAYSGWSADGNLVRWGDIKSKIAFENSDKKNKEDNDMERRALYRAN
jgi:hypothetical protein